MLVLYMFLYRRRHLVSAPVPVVVPVISFWKTKIVIYGFAVLICLLAISPLLLLAEFNKHWITIRTYRTYRKKLLLLRRTEEKVLRFFSIAANERTWRLCRNIRTRVYSPYWLRLGTSRFFCCIHDIKSNSCNTLFFCEFFSILFHLFSKT